MSNDSPPRRAITGALALLVLTMTLTVAAALWLALKQASLLAEPSLHSQLWRAYQIQAEMDRTTEAAQSLTRGQLDGDELVVRIQVLYSLIKPLLDQHLFDYLPELRPEAENTLSQIIALGSDWNQRATWGQTQINQGIAEEILKALPPLRTPMNEVIVAANLSLANELDAERQHLYSNFIGLGWTLFGLLVGGSLLVARLILDYRHANRLSLRLAELNQTLESRVSERTRELNAEQALLRYILEASPSDVALTSAGCETVYFVNRRLLLQQGLSSSAEYSLDKLFANPEEAMRFRQRLENHHRVDDWEALLAAPQPYWGVVSGRLLEHNGSPAHLVWSYDISLRKQMEQELTTLASTDALTGLNNRHAFISRAEALLKSAERFAHPCAALMLDIDHFKSINDRHGHQLGDRALQAVAEALKFTVREVDVLGRMGGEEFVVLLPQTDSREAWLVAERLRETVESLRVALEDNGELGMTLSLGIALRLPGEHLDSLIGRADKALYRAKAGGRNRTEVA